MATLITAALGPMKYPLRLLFSVVAAQRDEAGHPVVRIEVDDPNMLLRLPPGRVYEALVSPAEESARKA